MPPKPEPTPFTPVPTRKHIAGWTVVKQFDFIQHLAAFGSVAAAARAVGMSEASAWRLRARPGSDSFCRAWDIALASAGAHLFQIALDRALNGSTRQYWKNGELVGEQVAPSDRLLMWAVDRLRPRDALRLPNGDAVRRACANLVPFPPSPEDLPKGDLPKGDLPEGDLPDENLPPNNLSPDDLSCGDATDRPDPLAPSNDSLARARAGTHARTPLSPPDLPDLSATGEAATPDPNAPIDLTPIDTASNAPDC